MKIEFNKVTWYSKVLAIIIFVGTFAIAFYLGKEFGEIKQIQRETSLSESAATSVNVAQPIGVSTTVSIATYRNENLGVAFNYPTVIWDSTPGTGTVSVGTYEDLKNNEIYIGNKDTISKYISGQSMYLPPVSVISEEINSSSTLADFIQKEFGPACKLDQKKYLHGDANGDNVYNITVSWNPSQDGPPNCSLSDSIYKILDIENNSTNKVIALAISAQECSFPDPGYEDNGVCYDKLILDSFNFLPQ